MAADADLDESGLIFEQLTMEVLEQDFGLGFHDPDSDVESVRYTARRGPAYGSGQMGLGSSSFFTTFLIMCATF